MKTDSVRRQLVGNARKAIKSAAGRDGAVSSSEAKALPKDVRKAVTAALRTQPKVSVEKAVDAYASYVAKALTAVDKGTKGDLTATEARKIADLALRSSVLDVVGAGAPSGAGPVNRGQLDAAIEDVQSTWADNNIMDGMVGVAGTVVAGDARGTAARDLEASKGDDFDAFVGPRTFDGPRALSTGDLDTLAKAVNDDGFQLANRDGLAETRAQIDGIARKLGGPAGLEVAVARQKVKVSRISDTETFPAQVWTLRNPTTNDAVSFSIRKGSL